jgi:hypothetical protein
MQTERDNHVPEVPDQNETDHVEPMPDGRASSSEEGPTAGGVETVQPVEYDMEYLIKKARQYDGRSFDEFSFICQTCGHTFGEHYGDAVTRTTSRCQPGANCIDRFVENKKATEFFNALRQMVKFIKVEP